MRMVACCTCILRLKKVSFWAADASSWDFEYSLLPLKPSLESEPEDPCCASTGSTVRPHHQHA